MSATGYPSPASSAVASPLMNPNTPSVDASIGRGERSGPPSVDSSGPSAVQNAYRRIRLRTGDASSSSSVLSQDFMPFTDSPVEDSSFTEDLELNRLLRSTLPSDTLQRLRQFESGRRSSGSASSALQQSSEATSVQSPSSSRPISYLSSPVSPPRQNLLPRRSLLETPVRRRESSDDPSTFRGRHVAAREAAATSGTHSPFVEPERRHIMPYSRNDFELFRSMVRQRRSEPTASVSQAEQQQRRAEAERTSRSLDAILARHSSGSPSAQGPISIRDSRRNRAVPPLPIPPSTSSRPIPIDRLSTLSNFDVQNIPSPSSAIPRDRPLLFEEPTSYIPEQTQNPDYLIEELPNRGYSIRRTLTADGEEMIHTINMQGEEFDPLGWAYGNRNAYPEQQDGIALQPALSRRRDGISDIPSRPSSYYEMAPQQQWLRLDPDGDPYPMDDESNIRFESGEQTWDYMQPMIPPSDTMPRSRSSRDYYHHRRPRTFYKATSDPLFFGSQEPFCLDPLPTPLSEMLPHSAHIEEEGLLVPKHAVFAGR